MRDPIQVLKSLPWVTLLQNAGLTVGIATVVDVGLSWLVSYGVAMQVVPAPLLGLLGIVLALGMAFGVGALSILVTERLFPRLGLNTATLWALVACLALMLYLRTWLPIGGLFLGLDYNRVIAVMLGVFIIGRRYWRY